MTATALPAPWGPLPDAPRWNASVGPFELWVDRGEGEFDVRHRQGLDPLADALGAASASDPPDDAALLRFVTRDPLVSLTPALGDRSVVVRPEHPLSILPGQHADLVITTPLWVQLSVGGTVILDVPTFRPSDTWFGPTSTEGQLAYASRTRARLRAHAQPTVRGRASTHLRVTNGGTAPLPLTRVNLPVQRLPVWLDDAGFAWTAAVSLTSAGDTASVVVKDGPDLGDASVTRVAEPRTPEGGRSFARALSTLLG